MSTNLGTLRGRVRAQKNDDNDAAGIAEAATRPTMRFVELKTQDRLDLQTLHRARSRLVAPRKSTAGNHIIINLGILNRIGCDTLYRAVNQYAARGRVAGVENPTGRFR